jgi:DNA-binding transcriptional ArsR family regulator
MVQCLGSSLDLSFAALSDATRRGIIDQLGRADASITSLADRFQMTLTGMKKHIQVLERAGLVVTQKVGRVRTCTLGERGLEAEAVWIEAHRRLFEARFEALDEILSEWTQEKGNGSAG